MQVIAIRPIAPDEEILTSYIDLSLPRRMRIADLKERYYFDCDCSACEDGKVRTMKLVDPRESLQCRVAGCQGVAWLPGELIRSTHKFVRLILFADIGRDLGPVECVCTICRGSQIVDADSINTTIEIVEEGVRQYESLQNTGQPSPLTLCDVT